MVIVSGDGSKVTPIDQLNELCVQNVDFWTNRVLGINNRRFVDQDLIQPNPVLLRVLKNRKAIRPKMVTRSTSVSSTESTSSTTSSSGSSDSDQEDDRRREKRITPKTIFSSFSPSLNH